MAVVAMSRFVVVVNLDDGRILIRHEHSLSGLKRALLEAFRIEGSTVQVVGQDVEDTYKLMVGRITPIDIN